MTAHTARLAKVDQVHAGTVAEYDELVANIRDALNRCQCGHAIDSAEHAFEVGRMFAETREPIGLGLLLAVAVLRDVVAEGGARDGE
ncbi:hypothetical protein [Nocardia thailandica]